MRNIHSFSRNEREKKFCRMTIEHVLMEIDNKVLLNVAGNEYILSITTL